MTLLLITPVTAHEVGQSGQHRSQVAQASHAFRCLASFIPTNEAGAGFAGDATGCGVVLLDVARYVVAGGLLLKRAPHEPHIVSRAEGGPGFTRVSRAINGTRCL